MSSEAPAPTAASENAETKSIKVLVWDLDNTLWDGTLLEGDAVRLRPGVLDTLRELDRRGILHSVASKNESAAALRKLEELGVADFFLYPQIHWGTKSGSIQTIAESVNLGLDAIAFVDDQQFEREEVSHHHPQVLTVDVDSLEGLLDRPEFTPRFITDESKLRRQMYRAEVARKEVEEHFEGPQEEFLESLDMRFVVEECQEEDLQRAEELTVRTNQLNATGYTYSYEELDRFRRSPDHLLLVASLEDRYGSYGKIGLALIETGEKLWHLKLLLMSCRVMSRGVGGVLIHTILHLAKQAGVALQAEFRPTDRNRMMHVTYKFAGFREVGREGDMILLEHPLGELAESPAYLRIERPDLSDLGLP